MKSSAATQEERQRANNNSDEWLRTIVSDPVLHARWLNTLSMLENCGARKIARFEHPVEVTTTILKHAAEEFRHAFSLKRQIQRIGDQVCPDYRDQHLLAPVASRRYLDRLDVQVCRYLKNDLQLSGWDLRYHAYLLVTWAIEKRASELYPAYQKVLEEAGSHASMRAIIAEEDGHLAEMEQMLEDRWGDEWQPHAERAHAWESKLFERWHGNLVSALRTS